MIPKLAKVVMLTMATSGALSMVRGHLLQTAQGVLRGAAAPSHVSYLGVPYAGDPSRRRFRVSFTRVYQGAPPAPAWEGIREADRERTPCVSVGGGDEDCLLLDVHVPTGAGAARAVLVWLPGGGFLSADASRLHPRPLAARGVILVVVGYRVGPLGFLCLGRGEAPGNAGAKDVLLALRWVRDNIVAFGGDSARVTLGGQGAGAAAAEAVLLSPASAGLLHRAILQSGSALSPWAYNYDSEERAEALARLLTDSSDVEAWTSSLLAARADELMRKSRELDFAYFPFAICSEKEFEKEERLLGSHPIEILTRKRFQRVPMLIGSNSNEAYILAPTLVRAEVTRKARRDFALLLPEELRFEDEGESRQVAERVREAYFHGRNFTLSGLLEYFTDAHFSSHVARSARLHAAASELPVYYYEFAHGGRPGAGAPTVRDVHKSGAAHADELAYLFASGDGDVGESDRQMQERMATLWANFIQHGNPTPADERPAWEPLARGDVPEPAVYALGGAARDHHHRMWWDIYDTYYYRRVGRR